MSIAKISPSEAKRRIADGSAVLVDIREPMEHASLSQARCPSRSRPSIRQMILRATPRHPPSFSIA